MPIRHRAFVGAAGAGLPQAPRAARAAHRGRHAPARRARQVPRQVRQAQSPASHAVHAAPSCQSPRITPSARSSQRSPACTHRSELEAATSEQLPYNPPPPPPPYPKGDLSLPPPAAPAMLWWGRPTERTTKPHAWPHTPSVLRAQCTTHLAARRHRWPSAPPMPRPPRRPSDWAEVASTKSYFQTSQSFNAGQERWHPSPPLPPSLPDLLSERAAALDAAQAARRQSRAPCAQIPERASRAQRTHSATVALRARATRWRGGAAGRQRAARRRKLDLLHDGAAPRGWSPSAPHSFANCMLNGGPDLLHDGAAPRGWSPSAPHTRCAHACVDGSQC